MTITKTIEVTLENVHTFLQPEEVLAINNKGEVGIYGDQGYQSTTRQGWKPGLDLGNKSLSAILQARTK